ncbi:MAG: menaquinone-dependent protoporphyrinogen IX dehydrogenase [Pseudomonadota bacterium]|nr:menaquinone-dependent protoporphyrinogen IX dehydrogenase [Pseudomonadota bacterium]
MTRTLFLYSTVDGQTRRICERMRQILAGAGQAAEMVELGDETPSLDLAAFDQIVIGASIRYGKHRPAVHRFVARHRALLESKPSAFFSVNVVARKPAKNTAETNPYVLKFLKQTGWAPTLAGVFAGRIDYPSYRFVDRQVIRFIMWMTKGPTDPRAKVEFTDWAAVERFAKQLLAPRQASEAT